MASISAVTLGDGELDDHLELATEKILSFSFRAPKAPESAEPEATLRGRKVAYRPLQSIDGPTAARSENAFSLATRVRDIVARDRLYTDVEHHVLRVIRRGIQVYLQIYRSYEQTSGLDRLKSSNQSGTLGPHEEPELKEKIETASAVSLFACHCYILAQLIDYQRDAADALSFETPAPDELSLESRTGALHAGLYQLYRAIDAHARDDASLVRSVREASRQLAERLAAMQHSLQYLEFYTRNHFVIEPEQVRIAAFELPHAGATVEIQVPEKRPEEVVGNHVAKLEAMRIAQRMACYDVEHQANPFVDLGGFVFTFIGDGNPGTGKTTLIQMMVTLLRDYTQVAGLPLRYENFSVDEISDYQGRSGQNARRFCEAVLDPRVVGLGTIDDVDQVCGNRHDKNASAGQLEVTAVFMQQFAGANTIVRGNATFGLFSNYPEKVDDALRQRTQARFRVDGPQTRDDFTDLFHILLHRDWSLPLGKGYQPLRTQQVRRVIQEKYAEFGTPRSPALRKIFDSLDTLSSWNDFGDYLHALMEHDERFTGRAVKNIADAVRSRMMDFDLPEEWLEDRGVFFGQPYERRVEMIRELQGEVTPEMVIQEINRYAESETRYSEAASEREFEERRRQILLDVRARKAAADEQGGPS